MEIIIAVSGLYLVYRLMRSTLPAHVEPELIARPMSRSEYKANAKKYR